MGMGRETLSQAPVKVRGEKKIAASGTLCLAFSDLRDALSCILSNAKQNEKLSVRKAAIFSCLLNSTYFYLFLLILFFLAIFTFFLFLLIFTFVISYISSIKLLDLPNLNSSTQQSASMKYVNICAIQWLYRQQSKSR